MASDKGEGLPEWLSQSAAGVWHVQVWAQPGAKRSETVEVLEGRLKIRLAAPAVENKANQELLDFMAKALSVRIGQVRLIRGERGRRKTVCVSVNREPGWVNLEPER